MYLINNGNLFVDIWGGCYSYVSTESVPLNQWSFVGWVYNPAANSLAYYINGQQEGGQGSVTCMFHPDSSQFIIGMPPASSSDTSYTGSISNLQLYNTALSANDIKAMYLEGIGGAPINLRNLVGWWPLNGDSKDYSGNNNNGQASNVVFSDTWYSSYTAP